MTKVAFFDTWSRGTKITDIVALELKIKGIDTVFFTLIANTMLNARKQKSAKELGK